MKVVIQRVSKASVSIEGICKGSINKGLMILVGIGSKDTKEIVETGEFGADMAEEFVNDGPFTIVLDEYWD